jgi:hypothetical protein
MTDGLVTSALQHAPRLVANGVSLTDFEEVTAALTAPGTTVRAGGGRGAVRALGRDAPRHLRALSTITSPNSCSCDPRR